MLRNLLRGRLFRIAAPLATAFAAIARLTDAPDLILVLNALALPIAAGVFISYTPVAFEALCAPRPTRGHVLGLGIWISWLGALMVRLSSIAGRDFGFKDLLNSDYASTTIFFSLVAGGCHLWAPFVGDARPPPHTWVKAGLCVAASVAILIVVVAFRAALAPSASFHFG